MTVPLLRDRDLHGGGGRIEVEVANWKDTSTLSNCHFYQCGNPA